MRATVFYVVQVCLLSEKSILSHFKPWENNKRTAKQRSFVDLTDQRKRIQWQNHFRAHKL